MSRFALKLALWEGRNSVRRVGIYMFAISLGVAALVSVHSFREDVSRSIRQESRSLLGADVVLRSNRPLPDSVTSLVDSLVAAGHEASAAITVPTMARAPAGDAVRLVQLRAVEGGWPLYGAVRTEPVGRWGAHLEPGKALVDPAALVQLGVGRGDTLVLGGLEVEIVGSVEDLPTDVGFQTAIGPRVYVSMEDLEAAGVLGFGSLARYTRFLRIPAEADRRRLEDRYESVFEATGVGFRTSEEQAENLTEAVSALGSFLGLIGLGALLLGGIGVGSAIHVFVKERIAEVAVLRCIGARQGGVFLAYLLQAGGLGLLGSVLGAAVGVAAQQSLPTLLGSAVPVDVTPRLSPLAILGGVGVGVWVSVVFALLPLLEVRDVPPLRALRQDFDAAGPDAGRRRLDLPRALALGLLAASVLALSILEAGSWVAGAVFAGGLGALTAILWAIGTGAVFLARRTFPHRAPYVFRQGFSNLFRPQNQTVAVVLSLGFGAFIIGTVLQVQANLARNLAFDTSAGRPNLLLFDIQRDQREGVLELLPEGGADGAFELTPLIPSRLVAVNGVGRAALDSLPEGDGPERWALRREYRNTYRADLTDTEELVKGAWWEQAAPVADGVARISVDADLAEDLAVGVGDRLTWDVGGVAVESEIASLRRIDWSQFRTNFFVVFEPGALEGAPATFVVLTRIDGAEDRARFQRDLVAGFPNVSVLDVTRVQETLEDILGKVARAIRFLAGFAAFAGALVLAGAVASSRHQRQREGALLKTLGARRRQILAVLLTEYAALGTLAAATGLVLSTLAAAGLVRFVFDFSFDPAPGVLLAVWGGITLLTLVTGAVGSRDLLRRPPLPILRGE
jgi:putative ABC transport system permease protein